VVRLALALASALVWMRRPGRDRIAAVSPFRMRSGASALARYWSWGDWPALLSARDRAVGVGDLSAPFPDFLHYVPTYRNAAAGWHPECHS